MVINRIRRSMLLGALGVALAACQGAEDNGPNPTGIKGVHRTAAGKPVPDLELRDADNQPASLADLGEPLLVNLWASWCAPCVKELPTLQALSRRPGAPRVIALSQDMAPRGSVDAFLAKHGLGQIEAWHDPTMAVSGAIGAQVLPTTILYDSRGRETWRYVGDLDWAGAEARQLLAEAR